MSAGKTENHQRRRHPLCDVHPRIWQLLGATESLPAEIQRGESFEVLSYVGPIVDSSWRYYCRKNTVGQKWIMMNTYINHESIFDGICAVSWLWQDQHQSRWRDDGGIVTRWIFLWVVLFCLMPLPSSHLVPSALSWADHRHFVHRRTTQHHLSVRFPSSGACLNLSRVFTFIPRSMLSDFFFQITGQSLNFNWGLRCHLTWVHLADCLRGCVPNAPLPVLKTCSVVCVTVRSQLCRGALWLEVQRPFNLSLPASCSCFLWNYLCHCL